MNKKIIIVGGVAGGASTAARLRRLDENAEIIMVEYPELRFREVRVDTPINGTE